MVWRFKADGEAERFIGGAGFEELPGFDGQPFLIMDLPAVGVMKVASLVSPGIEKVENPCGAFRAYAPFSEYRSRVSIVV